MEEKTEFEKFIENLKNGGVRTLTSYEIDNMDEKAIKALFNNLQIIAKQYEQTILRYNDALEKLDKLIDLMEGKNE